MPELSCRNTGISYQVLPRNWGPCRLKDCSTHGPVPGGASGQRACAIIACYNGPTEDGQAVMAKLLEKLPPPLFNWMGEMALSGPPVHVRSVLPERLAMVLARRFRE